MTPESRENGVDVDRMIGRDGDVAGDHDLGERPGSHRVTQPATTARY